jgi:murein DD-endopeptidase MepM/ murein hydrolase activator NlpD
LLFGLLTAVYLSLVAGPLYAACEDDWICVDEISEGETVKLQVRNLREFPVTYTLKIRTRYMQIDGPKTITRTLPPNQSERATMLSPVDTQREGDYHYSFDWTVGDQNAEHNDDHIYSLPYASGKNYRVLQGYGSRFSHTGLEEFAIDFDMPVGTPVHAARGGVVARVEQSNSEGCWEDGCGKFANYIVVFHDDGTTGEYYHLMENGSLVVGGDVVAQGQEIGRSGNTGHTTMPHLHFAVYRAAADGNTQSVPARFQDIDGIIDRPRRGARYQAL